MMWKMHSFHAVSQSLNIIRARSAIINRSRKGIPSSDREGQPSTIDTVATRGFTRDGKRVSTLLNDAKYFVLFPRRLVARFPSSPTHEGDVVVVSRDRYPAIDRNPRHVRASLQSIVPFSTRARTLSSSSSSSSRTFLTLSKEATALVWTVFFATVVLETTRTPVKEVVKADMISVVVVLVVRTPDPRPKKRRSEEAKPKRRGEAKNFFGRNEVNSLVLCNICTGLVFLVTNHDPLIWDSKVHEAHAMRMSFGAFGKALSCKVCYYCIPSSPSSSSSSSIERRPRSLIKAKRLTLARGRASAATALGGSLFTRGGGTRGTLGRLGADGEQVGGSRDSDWNLHVVTEMEEHGERGVRDERHREQSRDGVAEDELVRRDAGVGQDEPLSPTRVVLSRSFIADASPHAMKSVPTTESANAPAAVLAAFFSAAPLAARKAVGTNANTADFGCATPRNSKPTRTWTRLTLSASVDARTIAIVCVCVCVYTREVDTRGALCRRRRRR